MFFKEIERLRGYAVTLTVAAHVTKTILPPELRCTWAGIDLFFAIGKRYVDVLQIPLPGTAIDPKSSA